MTVLKQWIFIGITIIAIILPSCEKDNVTVGEGTVTTKVLSISEFSGVDLTFSDNVNILNGADQEVRVTGHPNIIDKVTTSVSNNVWEIGLEDGSYNNYELSFEILIPNLDRLKLSGSGNLTVNDFNSQGDLDIDLSGSGNITLNKFEGTTDLDINLSGSGNFKANNDILNLDDLTIKNSGSGKYSGFEIISGNSVSINSSGSGKTELTANNSLDVTLSGSGDVAYKGTPNITQNITGSGSLIDGN